MTTDASKPTRTLSSEQRQILGALSTEGPRSRIELSRRLELNGTAVTRATQALIVSGLVQEAGALKAARGRPSLPLHVRPEGAYAVGAAVQPGLVDVAVMDLLGNPVAKGGFEFDDADPGRFALALRDETTRLIRPLNLRPSAFLGYGVSVPGFIGLDEGHRHTVERLKSWRGANLAETIGQALASPVWIENDANTAALAEFYASGRPGGAMLVFYLGHGVGGAAMINGDLFRGSFGNAGEVGLLYPLNKPRPSAVDLLRSLGGLEPKPPALADIAALSQARPDAVEAWAHRAADQLESAVLSGVAWLDPGLIVLSGVIPRPVLTIMRDHLDAAEWRDLLSGRRQPELVVSELGGFAGAVGAGLLPIHDLIGG